MLNGSMSSGIGSAKSHFSGRVDGKSTTLTSNLNLIFKCLEISKAHLTPGLSASGQIVMLL